MKDVVQQSRAAARASVISGHLATGTAASLKHVQKRSVHSSDTQTEKDIPNDILKALLDTDFKSE